MQTRQRRAGLALLLALAVPLAATVRAEGEPAERARELPEVVLVEPGAAPRVALRLRPEPGYRQILTMIMHMEMQQRMDGGEAPQVPLPPMRMRANVTIEDVAANGDFTYVMRYTEADAMEAGDVAEEVRQMVSNMLRSMAGVTVRGTTSDRGFERDVAMELPPQLAPQIAAQMRAMADSLEQFSTPLPEEPVGVGAAWDVRTTLSQDGITLRQTTRYRLRELEGGHAVLDIGITQQADEQPVDAPMPPGVTATLVSLEGRGEGTTRLDLAAGLPGEANVTHTVDQEMQLAMGNDARNLRQTMRMRIELRSEAPEDADD